MKKLLPYIVLISLIISCSKSKSHKGNMLVKGNIDGLKKGTLYLQKMQDTLLVSVDSIQLNGESNFILTDEIKSPEMYFIILGEKNKERIPFFGEKGEITITSKLEKLSTSVKITGSKNQILLEEFQSMSKKFNGKQLDYIKEQFEAKRDKKPELVAEIEKAKKNLIKKKYLFTTNFALVHSDAEVSPYLALTELYYANIKLLDTVNNSLSKKIKTSKYGLELAEFVKHIKENEK